VVVTIATWPVVGVVLRDVVAAIGVRLGAVGVGAVGRGQGAKPSRAAFSTPAAASAVIVFLIRFLSFGWLFLSGISRDVLSDALDLRGRCHTGFNASRSLVENQIEYAFSMPADMPWPVR